MTYLFDSDVIISNLNKKYDLSTIPSDSPAISVMTYAELLYGVEKSKNPKKRDQLESLIRDLHMIILPITSAIIKRFVNIKIQLETNGEKLADFDLLIAATAMEHHLTLVTANKKHFSHIRGLSLA